MLFKLTQSFFLRFVGWANLPDSKSLTVWYALSHMRRMTAVRQKVLIGVGMEYKSVDSDKELEVSRKEMVVLDISWVNLIERCRLLARERKFCNSSSLWAHFISTSSINLYQESVLSIVDSSSCFSHFPICIYIAKTVIYSTKYKLKVFVDYSQIYILQ